MFQCRNVNQIIDKFPQDIDGFKGQFHSRTKRLRKKKHRGENVKHFHMTELDFPRSRNYRSKKVNWKFLQSTSLET